MRFMYATTRTSGINRGDRTREHRHMRTNERKRLSHINKHSQSPRIQQLSDPDIGILLVELEVTNKRPKWESFSSGTSALKTL